MYLHIFQNYPATEPRARLQDFWIEQFRLSLPEAKNKQIFPRNVTLRITGPKRNLPTSLNMAMTVAL